MAFLRHDPPGMERRYARYEQDRLHARFGRHIGLRLDSGDQPRVAFDAGQPQAIVENVEGRTWFGEFAGDDSAAEPIGRVPQYQVHRCGHQLFERVARLFRARCRLDGPPCPGHGIMVRAFETPHDLLGARAI
jgi:hypothetical protein